MQGNFVASNLHPKARAHSLQRASLAANTVTLPLHCQAMQHSPPAEGHTPHLTSRDELKACEFCGFVAASNLISAPTVAHCQVLKLGQLCNSLHHCTLVVTLLIIFLFWVERNLQQDRV